MQAEQWIVWELPTPEDERVYPDPRRSYPPRVVMRGSEADCFGFWEKARRDRKYNDRLVMLPEVAGDEVEKWR